MKLTKLAALSTLLIANTALADWQLQQPSEVTFVSGKNSHLLEIHRFEKIAGSVSDQGQASITIDLSSIDSRIPVRDQRMRDHLFEVNSFASAEIQAQIPADVMTYIKQGKISSVELPATLSLHGNDEELVLKLLVAPGKQGELVVTSLAPVLIHADDFALTKGIQLLRDIAKLKVIGEVVPVTFALTFVPAK